MAESILKLALHLKNAGQVGVSCSKLGHDLEKDERGGGTAVLNHSVSAHLQSLAVERHRFIDESLFPLDVG